MINPQNSFFMAKQSGLHQLRGKVGEHSYYKQTGVASGLVRSINQGMSARVKTSEEYANVRLNNAEFGQAGRIAKVLGRFITPKYRPMILPFSQSKMCTVLLNAIKNDTTAPWGQRNLSSLDSGVSVLIDALNYVRKNDPESYGISISMVEDNLHVIADETLSSSKLAAMGANGYDVRVIAACPWIGTFRSGNYGESFARANIYDIPDVEPGIDARVDYQFRPVPPQGWPAFQQNFFVIIVMPYRNVNNAKYTLQEFCTYFAAEIPTE